MAVKADRMIIMIILMPSLLPINHINVSDTVLLVLQRISITSIIPSNNVYINTACQLVRSVKF